MDFNLDLPELTYRRSSGHALMSEIYLSLGNTGTATHRLWTGNNIIYSLPASHQTSRITTAANQNKVIDLLQLRHPDPHLTARLEVKEPELQVLGSWKKLHVKAPPEKLLHRYGVSCFIWKSKS